ncbi:MAG: chromosomal replication initiator protein DnaA [Phycisphaerales bacterium]|jgi:chromosomal replication initiator protein|nr:chromosomal replication initiator protein DnaA [Phycisphaerales bacterium]
MTRPTPSTIEQKLREELSTTIGNRPYRMWFTNTTVKCNNDSVDILAATPLAARWINDRFSTLIEDAAKTCFGKNVPIRITVDENNQQKSNHKTPTATPPKPTIAKAKRQFLSFDNFVVGSCNQLACAAAKQITNEDGRSISPLFIHGACGVGKTHLLQAISKLASKTSVGKVRYVTAEQFTNEFIASSRSGEFSRFRNRYRNLDLLAIDDVHFVASKIKTQEELLHTIDAAGLRGARLVLASDEDPRHIRRLNRALANRFVAGMIAEIQRPDRDTRCNIIQQLTQKCGIELTQGAIDRLASQAVGSIREIEGTVTQLRATANLLMQNANTPVGIDTVERLLRATPPTSHPIKMLDIIDSVCTRSNVSIHDLRGKSRSSRIVIWRSIASYLGRKLTSLSYPELATSLGRKNHSTVHAAVKRIDSLLSSQNCTVQIGEGTINLKETLDQLTWSIRLRANDNSASKPHSRKESVVG